MALTSGVITTFVHLCIKQRRCNCRRAVPEECFTGCPALACCRKRGAQWPVAARGDPAGVLDPGVTSRNNLDAGCRPSPCSQQPSAGRTSDPFGVFRVPAPKFRCLQPQGRVGTKRGSSIFPGAVAPTIIAGKICFYFFSDFLFLAASSCQAFRLSRSHRSVRVTAKKLGFLLL